MQINTMENTHHWWNTFSNAFLLSYISHSQAMTDWTNLENLPLKKIILENLTAFL